MPKVTNTRRKRAAELLERLRQGPAFSDHTTTFTPEDAVRQYCRWSESWIISELESLVPELKPKQPKA